MIATCGFHQPVLTAVLPWLGGSLGSYVYFCSSKQALQLGLLHVPQSP